MELLFWYRIKLRDSNTNFNFGKLLKRRTADKKFSILKLFNTFSSVIVFRLKVARESYDCSKIENKKGKIRK